MPSTCPHCGDDMRGEKTPKPGARVVCPSCFRSFRHEVPGPSSPFDELLDEGDAPAPATRSVDNGQPGEPLRRRTFHHKQIDTSKAQKQPFHSSRAVTATVVIGLAVVSAAGWYIDRINTINKGVGKGAAARARKVDRYTQGKVGYAEKGEEAAAPKPVYDDPNRTLAPKARKVGNLSVAVSGAMIGVVKLRGGRDFARPCLILTLQGEQPLVSLP